VKYMWQTSLLPEMHNTLLAHIMLRRSTPHCWDVNSV
jgi:hypothetical protein